MSTPVYPSIPINNANSAWTPIHDLVVDQWPNGNSRGRTFFNAGGFGGPIMHDVVSETDRATLEAFYVANATTLFDFVSPWDGLTYHNVGFVKPYSYKRRSGAYWDITTELRQFTF